MENLSITRLFSNVKIAKESIFDDIAEANEGKARLDHTVMWLLAVKIENNKIYQMYSSGDYLDVSYKVEWAVATGLRHSDIDFMKDEAECADRETECLKLEERGWTIYSFEDDRPMFNIAYVFRDFFNNVVLPA